MHCLPGIVLYIGKPSPSHTLVRMRNTCSRLIGPTFGAACGDVTRSWEHVRSNIQGLRRLKKNAEAFICRGGLSCTRGLSWACEPRLTLDANSAGKRGKQQSCTQSLGCLTRMPDEIIAKNACSESHGLGGKLGRAETTVEGEGAGRKREEKKRALFSPSSFLHFFFSPLPLRRRFRSPQFPAHPHDLSPRMRKTSKALGTRLEKQWTASLTAQAWHPAHVTRHSGTFQIDLATNIT